MEKEMETTPVFLPGESHGQRSLVGCSLWGHKESDMTEQASTFTSKTTETYEELSKKKNNKGGKQFI